MGQERQPDVQFFAFNAICRHHKMASYQHLSKIADWQSKAPKLKLFNQSTFFKFVNLSTTEHLNGILFNDLSIQSFSYYFSLLQSMNYMTYRKITNKSQEVFSHRLP